MGGIPLVALNVKPTQVDSPLEMLGKMQALRAQQQQMQTEAQRQQLMGQQLQATQLENEQRTNEMRSQQALVKAYSEANGNLKAAVPLAAKYGASPAAITALQKSAIEQETSNINLLKAKGERALQEADLMQGAHDAIANAPIEQKPALYQEQIAGLQKAGVDVSQMPPEYPGDQAFKLLGVAVQGHKQQMDELAKAAGLRKTTAEAAQAEQGTNLPVDVQAMRSWLAKPENKGKTPDDYVLWKAKNSPSAILSGAINLSPEAMRMAGDLYAQTGQLPGGLTRSPQTTAQVMNAAAANNPDNNIAQNKIQQATMQSLNKDFFGGGKSSQNIRSLNTAIGHLGQLYDAAEALKNNDIKALNRLANIYKVQTGNSAPQVFDAIATAATGELGSTFKGSAATDPEIASIRATINKDLSGKVNQDVIRTDAHLLMSRLYALEEQYKQASGAPAAKGRILYNGSRSTLSKMGVQPENETQQPAQSGGDFWGQQQRIK